MLVYQSVRLISLDSESIGKNHNMVVRFDLMFKGGHADQKWKNSPSNGPKNGPLKSAAVGQWKHKTFLQTVTK